MKQMIAQTLTKRLEQKSVDKITVKELVEACGISRQAFYCHFQDIMDVIEWITSRALDASVDASLAAPTPQQAIKTVILSLRENGELIQHLMASQRRPEIERLLVRSARLYLEKVLRAKSSRGAGRHVQRSGCRHPLPLLWPGWDACRNAAQRHRCRCACRPAVPPAHWRDLGRCETGLISC